MIQIEIKNEKTAPDMVERNLPTIFPLSEELQARFNSTYKGRAQCALNFFLDRFPKESHIDLKVALDRTAEVKDRWRARTNLAPYVPIVVL